MKTVYRRRFEMFLKARDFFAERAGDFPAASIGGALVAALVPVVEQLEALDVQKVSQTGAAAQGVDVSGDARQIVEDKTQDIADMTRAMAYEIDGLEEQFRMPRNRSKLNLIAVGHAFAGDAAAYQAQFIAYGMPANFIADLNAAVAALEAATSDADISTQARVGTNAAFEPLIKSGMEKIRRLDPIVKMKYRQSAQNFAAWIYASHIERAPSPNGRDNQPTPTPRG